MAENLEILMKENFAYLKDVLGLKHVSAKNAVQTLEKLQSVVAGCVRCRLSQTRTQTVFGSGNPKARIMFVGEGPGDQEDKQGLPFVGRSGQLLTKMIEAMGLKREDVYILNVVKCRPPNNRRPEKDEVASCEGYLFSQIELVNPEVMVALGATAMETLLKNGEKIGNIRGKVLTYRNRKLIVTYHPAYLLRNPPAKKFVWDDLKVVMGELSQKPPKL